VLDPDLRRALRFIVPYWHRLALVLALSFASTALSLYLPLLSRDFFDRALIGKDVATLVRVVLLFTLVSILSFAVNIVSGLRYTRVSADILFDMRLEMYRHLQRLSPRFYVRTRMGDIMSRINNDIGEIQRIAAETALAWVGNVLFLAGTVAMLAWLDVRLFLVTVATTPFGIWALVRYRGRLEAEVASLRQRSAEIGSFLIETLQATRLVVTSNAQERESARFRDRNAAFVRALMSMQRLSYLAGGLPGLILSAGTGAVFIYGGLRVVHGSITVGTFVAFMACQMRVLPPLQALMGMYANLATVRVSLRRVSEILEEPVEVIERSDAAALPALRGDIEFDDVTLSFGRGAAVLEHFSFAARAGEILAIVGPSGSGKSTIADLLLRLLDPDSGAIRLDGVDLKAIKLDDLRRRVALVDQEPCILHASIADNIRYARPDATDAELRTAARQAALDSFLVTLPQGVDTIVGERGMALSAGERQRIALARALLRRPTLLVLDEATSSLDSENERVVQRAIDQLHGQAAILIISHRLSTLRNADLIYVLEEGRIVESGTWEQLARQPHGRFRALCRAQGLDLESAQAPDMANDRRAPDRVSTA
jgi:ATP-binding cassette, subfamily B, bacterial